MNNALASNCFKLGKAATECYEMLKTAFGKQAMGRSQTFQWFSWFKAGRTSIDDDESSGRPVSSSTPEMIERVCQIICEDRCCTIDEVSMLVRNSHGTCHKNFYRRFEDATCRLEVRAHTPECRPKTTTT